MLSLDDQFDEAETSFFPLSVVRIYSAYIHKRRTVGPMGKGWLLKLWYDWNSQCFENYETSLYSIVSEPQKVHTIIFYRKVL